MNLEFHDEKHFNFWGGIYEMPEPDHDDAQCTEIAAICEHPDAPRLARLFCASPKLLAAAKALLEPLGSLVEGVVSEWDEQIAVLREAVARIEGETNGS